MKAVPGTIIEVELEDEEVKPCPFCGGEEIELTHTWTAAYWMACVSCGAQVSGDVDNGEPHSEQAHLDSATSALEMWNRRAA